MQRAVEIYAIINFTVIGLSHLLRPRQWVDFFVRLRERGDDSGVIAIGILNLAFGSIIAAFHNVWDGIPLLLTLVGWANVVKGAAYLTFPAVGRRVLASLTHARASRVAAAGAVMLLLAGLLAYDVWASG